MAHRAAQIVDQVASLMRANPDLRAQVFTHRTLSLAEDQGEMPAVCVQIGGDDPQTDNMAFIESLLTVRTIAYAMDPDESVLREKLLDLRTQIHVSLQADHTLGLDFVSDCRYGGAIDPQIAAAEQLIGAYESVWRVLYRMNRTDPE